MIVTIPFSQKDIDGALRLLKWIGWLSSQDGNSTKQEKVLVVPSRHAFHRSLTKEICRVAAEVFGEARCFCPEAEYEHGWPGACNFMLKSALEHVELHFQDDILLLEPDATPLNPSWLRELVVEYRRSRSGSDGSSKSFMGAYVPTLWPHMSGIAIYGRDWRQFAPKLADVQDHYAWDVYAADQIVPNAHFTDLIQHIQWSTSSTREMSYDTFGLTGIHPSAVIFHQDKSGRVMKLVDDKCWRGEADAAIGYSRPFKEARMPMRYFFNHNQNREIPNTGGIEIVFEPFDQLAGTWRGIMATEDEAVIAVLGLKSLDSASGIVELSQEDYEERTKKKVRPQQLSRDLVLPPGRLENETQITKSPAVLVENPKKEGIGPVNATVIDKIDHVIKIGKVKLPEHVAQTIRKGTAKKKAA